jgi:hypothetical protein
MFWIGMLVGLLIGALLPVGLAKLKGMIEKA